MPEKSMADSIITKQELIDAQKDAQTLEDVINGAAGTQVIARLGRTFWTLATLNTKLNSVETTATQAIASMNLKVVDVEAARVNSISAMNSKVAELQPAFDSKLQEFDLAINTIVVDSGVPALAVSDASGKTQQEINNVSVKNGDYAPVLGAPVKLMFDPSKFSLRYGLSDPLPLDNNTNMFRGLTNKDAWADENIGGGSVAFGRNGASVAYLTTTFGHDCITYGVASTAGGAGSGTGNPDAPTDGANYGYCSFAHGKDTAAIGRISTAFGQECKASSIRSYASGMQSEAGAALASHPNGVASGGESAWAHGYRAKAYGDFSFALGSFITAYNGAQIIGRGINPGSPLVNSLPDSLAMGIGVDVPTVIMTKGDGTNGGYGNLGINTTDPTEKVDINIKNGDKVAVRVDKGGKGTLDFQSWIYNTEQAKDVKTSIFKIEFENKNYGSAVGTTSLYQNGVNFLEVNNLGEATFKKVVSVEAPLHLSSYVTVGGKKILGGQVAAIADSTGTAADNQRAINAILTALRSHGLIAT